MHKDMKKKPTGNEYARGDYGYGGMAKKKMMGGGKVKRSCIKTVECQKLNPVK